MNVSGTTVSATGHKGGLGDGLYDRAGARPDLDLDFARTKSLKDRVSKEDLITFSRGASRIKGTTYVDKNGLVKKASHNLILYSHDIGNSNGWAYLSSSSGGSSTTFTRKTTETTAPNGMFEATKIVLDSGTTANRVTGLNSLTYSSSGTHIQLGDYIIFSVYLKSATNNNQIINLSVSGTGRGRFTVTPEWQRFAIKAKRDPNNPNHSVEDYKGRICIRNTGGSGSNHPQNDGSYINQHVEFYAWGAQFENDLTVGSNNGSGWSGYSGDLGELVKTTTQPCGAPRFTHDPETLESKGLLIEQESTNLLTYSEDFSQSYWNKDRVTLDSNTTETTAPDGTNTATKVTATSATNSHRIKVGNFSLSPNQYTYSIWVKAADAANHVLLKIYKGGPTGQESGNILYKRFKINSNGTTNIYGNDGTLTVEKYPNGWYKLIGTTKVDPQSHTYNASILLNILRQDAAGETFAGNGESIYVWGAQLEQNTFGTSYIPTSGSTVTRSPDLASIEGDNFGTYRQNIHSGVTPNLTLDDGVTGNNTVQSITNATVTPYAALAPDGTFSAVKLQDIETSSDSVHQISYNLEASNTSITIEANKTYTVTAHFKAGTATKAGIWLAGPDWATPSTPQQTIDLSTGTLLGTSTLISNNNATVTSVGDVDADGKRWYRMSMRCTTASSLSPEAKLRIASVKPSAPDPTALSYSGTPAGYFYVWGVQIEEGTSVTPYIPSTDTYTNRQSNATFVDGNGIIRRSMCNELLYSEDFSKDSTQGGLWQIGHGGIAVDNNVRKPDGTFGAIKYTPNTSQHRSHILYHATSLSGNIVLSAYVKAAGLTYVSLISQGGAATSRGVSFDLTTQTIQDSHNATGEIIDVGDGWYRLIVIPTTTTATNIQFWVLHPHKGGDPEKSLYFRSPYAQTVGETKGMYVWGAMLEKNATEAGDYYKTTDTISGPPRYSHDPETLTPTGLYLEPEIDNKATTTETFTDSNYILTYPTDTSNVLANLTTDNSITNPDGSTGTVLMTIPAGEKTRHYVKGIRYLGLAYATQTLSCFVKKKTSRYVGLSHGGAVQFKGLVFDFDTEAITTEETGTNFTSHRTGFVKYPNGWYRLFSQTTGATGSDGLAVHIPKDPTTSKPITGSDPVSYDGTESVYIWGLNCCDVGFLSTYIPNTTTSEIKQNPDIFTSTATEVLDRANGTKPAFFTTDGTSIYTEARYNASSHDNISNFSRILQLEAGTDSGLGLLKQGTQMQLFSSNPSAAPLFAFKQYNSGSNDLQIGVRYAEDNTRIYFNDNDAVTDPQGSLDTDVHTQKFTDLYIGNNGNSATFTNGTIKRISFWKTPFTDSKLEKLTQIIT